MMPAPLRAAVEAAWAAQLGRAVTVSEIREVGGGCISHASRLTATRGEVAFLKWAQPDELPAGMFAAEAGALQALRSTDSVRVPEVIDVCDAAGSTYNWLLLEWLPPVRASADAWEQLGWSLAQMHRYTNHRFGWPQSNFIGSLPQANRWTDDWPGFWREQRMLPQLERAAERGLLRARDIARFDALLEHLPSLLQAGHEDGASLLHGDLWGGNAYATTGGIALIDPSAYYGHREVDLAMAALFGGFDRRFFATYDEAWPQRAGNERRRRVYQLYYLLVHVNLFGGSYVASTLSAVGDLGF